MRHNRILALIAGTTLLVGLPASEASKSPSTEKELFGASSLGLPLGVLAAKYAPTLAEEPEDVSRRNLYTKLLQSAADELKITLIPAPSSLLSAGRGQRQYKAIESYFAQIHKQTRTRSECVRFTSGLSLNSAWIILYFHQAPHVRQTYVPVFKTQVLSRLDQFSGLATVASRTCAKEGYKNVSVRLETASSNARRWLIEIRAAPDARATTEVGRVGRHLADWLVDLAKAAGGPRGP
jgi:hypothetical protein